MANICRVALEWHTHSQLIAYTCDDVLGLPPEHLLSTLSTSLFSEDTPLMYALLVVRSQPTDILDQNIKNNQNLWPPGGRGKT